MVKKLSNHSNLTKALREAIYYRILQQNDYNQPKVTSDVLCRWLCER